MNNVFIKWLLSFLKRDWILEDYPLRYQYQGDKQIPGISLPKWSVQIVKWEVMNGLGTTKGEAIRNLQKKFGERKKKKHIYRPGVNVPPVFTSAIRIKRNEAIVRKLLLLVLGVNYDSCFISDESTLGDFTLGNIREGTIDQIQSVFGVDVSGVTDGNIANIAEIIAKAQ